MSWTDHTLALPLPAARSAGVPEPTVQLPARGSTQASLAPSAPGPSAGPGSTDAASPAETRAVGAESRHGPGDSGTEPLDHGASAAAATATAVAGAVGSARFNVNFDTRNVGLGQWLKRCTPQMSA